ncbi:MAG: NADH-quinone oxidoreductase subunit A [Capsulimonadaceae bacterium]
MQDALSQAGSSAVPSSLYTVNQFLPLLVLLIFGVLLALVLVGLSWILGPKKPSADKLGPYECGVTPVGSARERFPVKFYLIAMLFIVFDIETVFLYPWAVIYTRVPHAMQLFELAEMIVFVVILFVGYLYVWKKGAFEWE